MKTSLLLIPIVVLCSILLFTQEIQTVFADATVTVVTPTGGTLDATDDCLDITSSNNVVWTNCSGVLFAIDGTSNTVIAEIASTGITGLEACIVSTCVLAHDNVGNDMLKYTLSGGVITQTGFFSFPCDTQSQIMEYDSSGFIWMTCGTSNQVLRFNPQTMTLDLTSQALTASCQAPARIQYSATDNIGVVYCATGTNIITFSKTTSTTVSILDNEVSDGIRGVIIDGGNNRIVLFDAVTRQTWLYSALGILTLVEDLSNPTVDTCKQEAFANTDGQGLFFLCMSAGDNTFVTTLGFFSNATGVFQVFSGFTNFTDGAINGMGIDFRTNAITAPLTPVYYINSQSNNIKHIKVTDLRSLTDGTPDPPEEGDGDDPEGNDPEDVDTDGDTIPNSEDDDIDGDTIPNSQDGDIDGDGIPNADDDTPCGSNSCIVNNTCVFGTASQCRSNDGAIGEGGTFVIEGIERIICSVGIVDCNEDSNMKTNGVGLILTVIAIMVMIGMFWVTTRGDLGAMPMFIWFIAVLGIVGFAVIADIIDATFLILAVVAMIALATAKLRGLFGGEFK